MQERFLQKNKIWLDGLTPRYSAGSRGLPAHSGCAPCPQSPGPWPAPPAAELAVVEGQSCGGPDQRSNTAVYTSFLPVRSAHLLINPFTAWSTLASPPPQHMPFKPSMSRDQSYSSVINPFTAWSTFLVSPPQHMPFKPAMGRDQSYTSVINPYNSCSWCHHPHNTCDSSQPGVKTKATLVSHPKVVNLCAWRGIRSKS